MSIADRLSRWTVLEFLEAVASRAEDLGWQAGIGGMETAGAIISYLSEHPEDVEPFMVGGISELPSNFLLCGRLTWHAAKGGAIVEPHEKSRRDVTLLGAPANG